MPPDDTMLRAADVVRITGLSLATLKRMTIDGRFAKPLHLSPHRIGWPGKDVRMWLEERDAARRKARP
jgi:predicted DNA-binding transcriptional regulator AlpA